ncbi:MAG: putative transcriptional regulator [Marinobacter excellens HL-55]|uniref:Putative transcriptional regulator n=1 Tax=Marinobacter excellens HL-55 TaxID=1305731 RepID=A0A0P7ZJL8_9GAMM|nr:MAG: putative transcriptional regulator [Marinobacter excellens HL-55]
MSHATKTLSTNRTTDKLLRPSEVAFWLGISRATLYRYEKQSGFPGKIRLSPRCVGWWESDLANWLEARGAA